MKYMSIMIFLITSNCWNFTSASEKFTTFSPLERYKQEIIELELVATEIEKFYQLDRIVTLSYVDEDQDFVNEKARELLAMSERFRSNWNYGNAVHHGNIALGKIALRNQDLMAAKEFLMLAGRTPGSPQLGSFGPNMSLAKEFLKRGEKQVVLDYLTLCQKFWEFGDDKIEFWKHQISRGKVPNFGANLIY